MPHTHTLSYLISHPSLLVWQICDLNVTSASRPRSTKFASIGNMSPHYVGLQQKPEFRLGLASCSQRELIMNAFTGRQPGREREGKGRGSQRYASLLLSICETLRTLRIRNATTNPTRRVIYKLIAKLRAAHRTRNTHWQPNSNALSNSTQPTLRIRISCRHF